MVLLIMVSASSLLHSIFVSYKVYFNGKICSLAFDQFYGLAVIKKICLNLCCMLRYELCETDSCVYSVEVSQICQDVDIVCLIN